jgi:hypothetical protein
LIVLAIDPGTRQSGWVIYASAGQVIRKGILPNASLEREIAEGRRGGSLLWQANHLALEMVAHYGTGMAVGQEIFVTCLWIGRFMAAWGDPDTTDLVLRATSRAHVCGSARASDANVSQALRDRFGGDSVAVGDKPCPSCNGRGGSGLGKARVTCSACNGSKRTPPGPLQGFSSHMYPALGVAIAFSEGCRVVPREEYNR